MVLKRLYYIFLHPDITLIFISDRTGSIDKIFAIAGSEDKDANTATTLLITPGFKGKDHPQECLRFWYTIRVRPLEIFLHHIQCNYLILLNTKYLN